MSKKKTAQYQSLKKIKKDQKKALTAATSEAFKKLSLEHYAIDSDPEVLAQKGGEMLSDFCAMKSGKEKSAYKQEVANQCIEYCKAMSLDTDTHALNGIKPELRGMAIDMMRKLKKEYGVNAPQDKAYAQIAVSAFCRYIGDKTELNSWGSPRYLSNEWSNYITALSKDADKAFRQYNAIIQYFESKKNPPIVLNVKTNTAFIAQNQQNIANKQDQNENNVPK